LANPTTTSSTSIATNPLAKPKFKGDREKLVEIVDGYPGLADYLRKRQIVPRCFSDPNLESGVCNPHLPLKGNEPHLCAFHKSCLVAKLLSNGIKCSPFEAREKPYEEILAEADALFDQPPDEDAPGETDETKDRQTIRGHALSISLQPPLNPFRKNSIRRLVLDILSRDWISLADLKAVLMSKKGIKRLDLIVHQVTSIATQEHYGYRIIESMGRFKAFKR
jgi:hypothetical protein